MQDVARLFTFEPMKLIGLVFVFVGSTLPDACFAQHKHVVIDLETHRPLRDILAYTNTNENTKTNYKGEFTIFKAFKRLVISHPNYYTLELSPEKAQADTIYLVPKFNKLQEVIITAKAPHVGIDVKKMAQEAAAAAPATSGISFDFFSMFDRSKRHVSKKEREKMKRILDKY